MIEMETKYKNEISKIILNNGIINESWSFLNKTKRYVIIADNNSVKSFQKTIKKIPNCLAVLTIKDDIKSKTINIYEKIVKNLINLKISKDDILIAFGGESVNHITGFIASTYQGGLEHIHIPTTIISQINSSIGGKYELNINDNPCISTTSQPSKIIIDTNLLKALSFDEFNNGIVEIIRYALIADEKLFNSLFVKKITPSSHELLDVIYRCITIKNDLLTKQPTSIDKILKFGYNYYSIIKKVLKGKINPIDIVIIGIYYELPEDLKNRFLDLIRSYDLNFKISEVINNNLLEVITSQVNKKKS